MKRKFAIPCLFIIAIAFITIFFSFTTQPKTPRILVFYKTAGYYHKSIPAGIAAIKKLGTENGFVCDETNDSLQFNTANLQKYDAVIFCNTTGNVLDEAGQKAFEQFIRSGKGYVGIHSATDTEYGWPWYNQLVGAYFKSHPEQQKASLQVKNNSFIATKSLPPTWSVFDEWYNFKDTYWDKVNVLITLDETSIKGANNGDFHPISWYRDFDGGRSFYTGLGHRDELFSDELFLKHLLGGIQYAIGK